MDRRKYYYVHHLIILCFCWWMVAYGFAKLWPLLLSVIFNQWMCVGG